MDKELIQLIKKVKSIFEQKQLPSNIKEIITSIYQGNFNEDYMKTMKKIQDKYEEKCAEKAEVITIVLSTLEPQKNKSGDEQIEKSKIDILEKCVRNNKQNSIIIDVIRDSIRRLKINENDDVKFTLEEIKREFGADDEQILEVILTEYEQYRKNEQKNSPKDISEDSHRKFVDKYVVLPVDLQKASTSKTNIIKKEKENENLSENRAE